MVTALSVATTPSTAAVENVVKSINCNEDEYRSKMPTVEDADTAEEEGWSVVSNDE